MKRYRFEQEAWGVRYYDILSQVEPEQEMSEDDSCKWTGGGKSHPVGCGELYSSLGLTDVKRSDLTIMAA